MLKVEVVASTHSPQHLSIDDNLTAHIVGRFKEDWIHAHIRCNAGCFCLHDLCTAHFHAVLGDKGIQCHIL